MDKNQIKKEILRVLEETKVGSLATVQNNKPHSRYMTFSNDEFTLYTATSRETHKTEEINKNPNVHILIGYAGEGYGDTYLEIEGTATVNESEELKKKLWNSYLEKWFKGPDDPDYIILQVKPSLIRLMNEENEPPQTLEL